MDTIDIKWDWSNSVGLNDPEARSLELEKTKEAVRAMTSCHDLLGGLGKVEADFIMRSGATGIYAIMLLRVGKVALDMTARMTGDYDNGSGKVGKVWPVFTIAVNERGGREFSASGLSAIEALILMSSVHSLLRDVPERQADL
jgi:hypothetical protein